MRRRRAPADTFAMRRLRHAWPHGILFAYAATVLGALMAVGPHV